MLKVQKCHYLLDMLLCLGDDVKHGGAEYSTDNIRYHLYVDVVDAHVASDGSLLKWVRK